MIQLLMYYRAIGRTVFQAGGGFNAVLTRRVVSATRGCRNTEKMTENFDLQRFIARPARPEDYAGVMKISEGMFHGMDIIPTVYFRYMRSRANILRDS